MRLMQTIAGGKVGGAEEFFIRLTTSFARTDLNQSIVMRKNLHRSERLDTVPIKPVYFPFGGLIDLRSVPGLARKIEEFNPTIILSWMARASQITGNAIKKTNVKPILIGRLGGYYNMKYFKSCDHLIGNTPDVVQYLVNCGWPPERAHYVPNFVSDFSGNRISRRDLKIPDSATVALAAGRLHPNKAFDVLIHALEKTKNIYLLVAGEGQDKQKLEKLARTLGVSERVRFLGWRDDIQDLMASADMLVSPSRIEPLGNVILEAWAAGLPVVATNSQGPAWLIQNKQNGLITPVDDPEALSVMIRSIASNSGLARRIAVAGRKRFEEEFREEAVVQRYIDLFKKVSR